jgi:5-methyltetrahydropteroyltriglutamate--homocysteine methyltransferase
VAIPTESLRIILRPPSQIEAARGFRSRRISRAELFLQYESAVQDGIARDLKNGFKVAADGERAKVNFAIYPIHGLTNIAAGRIPIPFEDSRHTLFLLNHIGGRSSTIPS